MPYRIAYACSFSYARVSPHTLADRRRQWVSMQSRVQVVVTARAYAKVISVLANTHTSRIRDMHV